MREINVVGQSRHFCDLETEEPWSVGTSGLRGGTDGMEECQVDWEWPEGANMMGDVGGICTVT